MDQATRDGSAPIRIQPIVVNSEDPSVVAMFIAKHMMESHLAAHPEQAPTATHETIVIADQVGKAAAKIAGPILTLHAAVNRPFPDDGGDDAETPA